MSATNTSIDRHVKFSKSVLVIFLIHFATKFSQTSLQGTLPIYFVDKLKFNENEATATFHILELALCSFSVVGGLIADSICGKYNVLLKSLILISLGFIVLAVISLPIHHLPLHALTLIAVFMVNFGFGIKAPCIGSLGGDQFLLPQQDKQLSLFFVLLYTVSSIASVMASFFSPILRKDIRCFGELNCYSLVFVIPAGIVFIGLVTFASTKKLFRIEKDQFNITEKFIQCIHYALSQKLTSKDTKKHWLDYANDKYETEFIEDVKFVFQTLTLLLPTAMIAALYAAEFTTMTFQASRMNGEVSGYLIKPDQILMVQYIFSIFTLPTLHYYIYPFLARLFRIDTHLKKITVSLFLAALSYYIATIVELNLESTYAVKPTNNNAHLRIYNVAGCKAIMTIDEQKFAIDELHMWADLDISITGKKVSRYNALFEDCRWSNFKSKKISGSFEIHEKQVTSFALTEEGLIYKFMDHNKKSDSGNPLVRVLINSHTSKKDNTLKIAINSEVLSEITIHENITKSDLIEVVHGTYTIYLNSEIMQSEIPLKVGGVYTILGQMSNSSKSTRLITITTPNSIHIFWLLPQLIIFSLSVIMFDPTFTDFLYSQAPSSMKAFFQSYPDISLSIGHLTVIVVTYTNVFDRKVFVFLLYAVLMTIATVIFALLADSYKYRKTLKDDIQQDNAE